MLVGGALLAIRSSVIGTADLLGIVAVAAATIGWALDNTLTRPLADLDPRAVVFWKSLLGAAMSTGIALIARDRWPSPVHVMTLIVCGASGYGLSLRLYLR